MHYSSLDEDGSYKEHNEYGKDVGPREVRYGYSYKLSSPLLSLFWSNALGGLRFYVGGR
jgi:hypothetical protein